MPPTDFTFLYYTYRAYATYVVRFFPRTPFPGFGCTTILRSFTLVPLPTFYDLPHENRRHLCSSAYHTTILLVLYP